MARITAAHALLPGRRRALLAPLVALTAALSLLVLAGDVRPGATDESGDDDEPILIEAAFRDQPVDADLDGGAGYAVLSDDDGPVTVEWSFGDLTEALRADAVAALAAAMGVECDPDVTGGICDLIDGAVEDKVDASLVAELLAEAIDDAIEEEAIAITARDLIAGEDLHTTSTSRTDTSSDDQTVTTEFEDLTIDDDASRRRVALHLAADTADTIEPFTVEKELSFDVAVDKQKDTYDVRLTSSPALRLGSATSEVFRLWEDRVDCTGGQDCTAAISASPDAGTYEGDEEVHVEVSSPSGKGSLLLGWLGDRETPGEDLSTCGDVAYQGLPGTILFDVEGFDGDADGDKFVTVVVPKDIVQETTDNGKSKYEVCFLGQAGLDARDAPDDEGTADTTAAAGDDTEPFLLESCTGGAAPCIEEQKGNRGGLEVVIRLPAADPMFR